MSRYDSQGYRADGRRQILGYSRQAQGGADQARARANQRLAEGWNPSLRNARRRRERVDEAKEDGTFDETRDTYNEEGQAAGVEMDKAGNIAQKPKPILATTTEYTPKKPARSTPLSYARPASQRLADAVDEASGMSTTEGLLGMARKARRKNYVTA